MTQKGEEKTFQGEINKELSNTFSFNQEIILTDSFNPTQSFQSNGTPSYPENPLMEIYQMIFVLKGSVQFNNGGNQSINDTIGTYQHNLYCFFPNSNTVQTNSDLDDAMWITLSETFVNRYLPRMHPVRKKLSGTHNTNTINKLSADNMPITPEIGSILKYLKNTSTNRFCGQLMLESKAIELLSLQLSQYENLPDYDPLSRLDKDQEERMYRAREIIIKHTGKQLSLKELANRIGTNEFNLKRDFKVVFGNTVYGYLKQYKMEEAKSMLMAKEFTVSEISQKMGYTHATHFTSAFKKYFGYLPNKLRTVKFLLLMLLQDLSMITEFFDLLFAF